jgi:hypothetical protein
MILQQIVDNGKSNFLQHIRIFNFAPSVSDNISMKKKTVKTMY